MTSANTVELKFDGQLRQVEFEDRVAQRIDTDDVIIVRTEPASGSINNENVYGLALDGSFLWRIQRLSTIYSDSPYTNIARKPDGFHAQNWDGTDTRFDIVTGALLGQKQGR